MPEPKFNIDDIVQPAGYTICGDIVDKWRVRGGWRYRIMFEDGDWTDANEKSLKSANEIESETKK